MVNTGSHWLTWLNTNKSIISHHGRWQRDLTPIIWLYRLYTTVLESIQRFLFLRTPVNVSLMNSIDSLSKTVMMMMKMLYKYFIFRKLRQKWPGAGWGRETYQPKSSPTISPSSLGNWDAFNFLLSTTNSPSLSLTWPHPPLTQSSIWLGVRSPFVDIAGNKIREPHLLNYLSDQLSNQK